MFENTYVDTYTARKDRSRPKIAIEENTIFAKLLYTYRYKPSSCTHTYTQLQS